MKRVLILSALFLLCGTIGATVALKLGCGTFLEATLHAAGGELIMKRTFTLNGGSSEIACYGFTGDQTMLAQALAPISEQLADTPDTSFLLLPLNDRALVFITHTDGLAPLPRWPQTLPVVAGVTPIFSAESDTLDFVTGTLSFMDGPTAKAALTDAFKNSGWETPVEGMLTFVKGDRVCFAGITQQPGDTTPTLSLISSSQPLGK